MIYDFILLLRNPFTRKQTITQWLVFTLVTALGWTAAGFSGLPVGRVVVVEGGTRVILEVLASMSLLGALIGALTGAGQWVYFRRRYDRALLWLPGTALGWGLGLPAALFVNFLAGLGLSAALYALIIGALVALLQWLFCRQIIPRLGRWIWANLIALPLAVLASGWLDQGLLIATGGQWGLHRWQTALSGGLAGLIFGLITGIALAAFLASDNPEEA